MITRWCGVCGNFTVHTGEVCLACRLSEPRSLEIARHLQELREQYDRRKFEFREKLRQILG